MHIAFFGSSLVSAYWNGAATYYRGLLKALARRGHRVDFYEPDAFDRQKHRDIANPAWARVVVYSPDADGAARALEQAGRADLVVKASGVGVLDGLLERDVLSLKRPGRLVAFWDVDAPATLERIDCDHEAPFRELIPAYDLVFTYGGGPPIIDAYMRARARRCVPIYNALDPETHHPDRPDTRFSGLLGLLANRLPDREARVHEFFIDVARRLPAATFVLGGSGWNQHELPGNVHHVGHVYTCDHNRFNCSSLAVLNVHRESMARCGHSPATRVFEAAGAGACLLSDHFRGVERFLEPDREILLARTGCELAEQLARLTPAEARAIGERARARVLAHHTYEHRARDVERALDARRGATPSRGAVVGREASRSKLVVIGLSITSSWGNGHATTYRGLIRELARRGHDVLFLERDVPWYEGARDLPAPSFCRTELYRDLDELRRTAGAEVRGADTVIVGSYVPDGRAVIDWVLAEAGGTTAFYDIDTPVTVEALEHDECAYLARRQVPSFDLYLSFSAGRLPERLEQRFGARLARPLLCSVDPYVHRPLAPDVSRAQRQPPRWDLVYLGTYSSDRQPTLTRLLLEAAESWPEGRFAVAGAQYPTNVQWPSNVEHFEHIAPTDHAQFFQAARFTLNVTRRAMIACGHSPSVRLFEAAACGTPIISDYWAGLDEFFELDREILVAASTADTLGHLRETSEPKRLALAARAQARVLSEHTAGQRADELERYLSEARSGSIDRQRAERSSALARA